MANVSEPTSFTAKPTYNDTSSVEQQAVFITAKFSDSGGAGYQPDDRSSFFTVKAYKSVVRKRYDYSFGGHTYFGSYDVQGAAPFNGQKGFYGAGLFHDGNLRIGTRRKWLHLGYRVDLWYEGGEFDQFRDQARNLNNFEDIHPQNLNIYFGFQHKFIFAKRFGTYSNFGALWGINNIEATPLVGGGLFFAYDCCVFDVGGNVSPELSYLNFSFHYKLK